jgi:hypothetical protein
LCFKIINDTRKKGIYDCFHEIPPRDWKFIEKSFYDWLNKFIDNKFETYWIK